MPPGNLGAYSAVVNRATLTRHHGADGALGARGHRGQHVSHRPGLDGLDRCRRRDRLPGRALPGCGLHHLRAGGDADGHVLQRHRSGGRDHLPLPGAGGRRGRQPERLLRDRHGDDPGRAGHVTALGPPRPWWPPRTGGDPGSTSAGPPRPTTSQSPATGSSAVRACPARTSRRWGHRPVRRSATPA